MSPIDDTRPVIERITRTASEMKYAAEELQRASDLCHECIAILEKLDQYDEDVVLELRSQVDRAIVRAADLASTATTHL